MCGIAGFVGKGGEADIRAMTRAVAHRGPDAEDFYVDRAIATWLGHRRLAILDLSGGAQPMKDSADDIVVIYNGEIYNHRELRFELEALGHQFHSDHSDTEVLIHGYKEWSEDLPRRLNGMFAFAVLDRRRKRIFLARDRFGEKPLYYARQRDLFIFASELSAITAHRGFDARLHAPSVQKYFAYGYVPAPGSLLQNTHKLPGGSQLTFDLSDGQISVHRYWQFNIIPDGAPHYRCDDDLIEELRALLFQAVRRRLMSDVPLGLFLSGGLDSSAVLAGAARATDPTRIQTFTIGFTEPSYDESSYASSVAAYFQTCHRTERLNFDDAVDLVPKVLDQLDEPLADASLLPTYLLSHFARQSVTVALSGDGGDELFAGYDPFAALWPASVYHKFVPTPVHRALCVAANALPISTRNMGFDFRLRRMLAGLSHEPAFWNPVWLSPAASTGMHELFDPVLPPQELFAEALSLWETSNGSNVVDRTLEFYTNIYLQDGILVKADRAAMMSSLESRAIFLDNDLVDFCQRLPTSFKLRKGARKYLLRQALRGLVPDEVLSRPKKGFGIPLARWLRSMPTPSFSELDGIMNTSALKRLWGQHHSGKADHRLLLWAALVISRSRAVQQPRVRLAA